MMKILIILTNGFDPDLRTYKEAKYLVNKGYDVEILAWDRESRHTNNPEEIIDGIKVKRFFTPSKYGSGIKQVVPMLKFMLECKEHIKNNPDIKYCHCADLDGMVTGYLACNKNIKLVFDMREFYESGNLSKIKYIVRYLVKFMQSKCYKVIYLNDLQKSYVTKSNTSKLVYLPNYPEGDKFKNIEKVKSEKIRISFIGYVRHYEPLKALIEVAGNNEKFEVYIHGKGVYYKSILNLSKAYNNCFVTGEFNHDDIIKLYNNTDILYCVYNVEDRNDKNAYPTKFFESIITDTPIIVAENTVIGDYCIKNNIGFTVSKAYKNDLLKILNIISTNDKVINEMINNIKILEEKPIWEQVVNNLDEIYK